MQKNINPVKESFEERTDSLDKHLVSQINQKDEEIARLKQELAATHQYLNDFVYTSAHALKSPVANLNLITILLEKTNDIEEVKGYLDTIKNSIKRLDQNISGMVSGFQVQTEKGNPEIVTLESIVETVIKKIKGNYSCLPVKVKTNYEVGTIFFNKKILTDILNNLLQNALNYKSEHGELEIEINSEKIDDMVLLEVKDNGIGIDMEKHVKDLFQPFKKFSSRSNGNGMGLYLSKILIEKYNGKIEVISKLNYGTTVKCYFKEPQK